MVYDVMSRARDGICRNPDCVWREEKRSIRYPKAGAGMYLEGAVICECGWAVELLPDPPRVTIVR